MDLNPYSISGPQGSLTPEHFHIPHATPISRLSLDESTKENERRSSAVKARGIGNAQGQVKKYNHIASRLYAPTTASRTRATLSGTEIPSRVSTPRVSARGRLGNHTSAVPTPRGKVSRPASPAVSSRPSRVIAPTSTTTPKRAVSPAVSKRPVVRPPTPPASPNRLSSPKMAPSSPKSLPGSPRVVSMSPMRSSTPREDSFRLDVASQQGANFQPALTLSNMEHQEELARVEVEVLVEVELGRLFEACLGFHLKSLSSEVLKVNAGLQNEEKRKRADELFAKSLESSKETIQLRAEIKALRSSDRVVATLRDQLKATNRFNNLRMAKYRQKEATIRVIGTTTEALVLDNEKLLAELLETVTTMEALAEVQKGNNQMADSNQVRPLQHMVIMMERDRDSEHSIECNMLAVEDYEQIGASLNAHIAEQTRGMVAAVDQYAAETEVLVAEVDASWKRDRAKMLAEKAALSKEITDLNFQIRRGTNIKSLSQLPHVPNQQVWSEVREMYISLEEEKAALERIHEDYARLMRRSENLRLSHANHFERLQRQVDELNSERVELLTSRSCIQQDLLTVQQRSIEARRANGLQPLPADEEDEAVLASTNPPCNSGETPTPDAAFGDEFLQRIRVNESLAGRTSPTRARPNWIGVRTKVAPTNDAARLPQYRGLKSTTVRWTKDRLEALCKPTLGREAYMGARAQEVWERQELLRPFER